MNAEVALLPAQHADHDIAGPVPRDILDRPVTLRPGSGRAHQKVPTASRSAQAFYDQGLAYLHSYVWIEAARSFYQALRLDPHLGMAYLALADTYIGLQDVPSARRSCTEAEALKANMSSSERAWLTIRDREVAYLESGGDPKKNASYRQAVDDAIETDARDPWLLVQRGLAAEASPFTHGQASGAESLRFYKKALLLDPNNLAAFHYSIHANENLGNIKEALAQSSVYARLAYSIPHAHHMHGHELMRMGRTEKAIQEFLKANELEDNYYQTEKIPPQFDWHHAHNLQLLALNYELLGQIRNAEQLLRKAFALPASTELLGYNRRVWPEFLISLGRYNEALGASRELANSDWPMARAAAHTLAGEAYLGLNRLGDAHEELAKAEKEAQHIPAQVLAALPYPAALKAAILLRENRTKEGEGIYVGVAHSALAMPGPDGWISAIFLLESIARDARDADDWPLAEYIAEEMIQHNPSYAGGHFAMGMVAEHRGETDGAREMFGEAERRWIHADRDLPDLNATRQKLSSLH